MEARDAALQDAVAAEPPRRRSVEEAAGTAVALRDKEVELRDFYQQHTRARGTWKGRRPPAGDSPYARMAGDRAARSARLGSNPEMGGSRPAIGSPGMEL